MLLFSTDFTKELTGAICKASNELIICSAFIKENAIKHLLKNISNDVSVSIIARWAKHDLIMGASDLEVYNWCQSHGFRFGINSNLHAKLYMIDQNFIFMGSANLTHRGLSISGAGNVEIGTRIVPEDTDLEKLTKFLNAEVEWVDEELFSLISCEISEFKPEKNVSVLQSWSEKILTRLNKDIEYLWVHDLLKKGPNEIQKLDFDDMNAVSDFELLDLDLNDMSADAIKQAFISTRLYSWIRSKVGFNNEVRFGWLTQELHNALLDDVTPYRREVKDFIVVLFQWFKFMPEKFEVKKYNHTETVTLKIE